MREVTGDIWDYHAQGYWLICTTNGNLKANGEAVMGAGIARQVRDQFPRIARDLGDRLEHSGIQVEVFPERIIALPTKWDWKANSDPMLIRRSIRELDRVLGIAETFQALPPIVSVRPGCTNGKLSWEMVRPMVQDVYERYDITVVERP